MTVAAITLLAIQCRRVSSSIRICLNSRHGFLHLIVRNSVRQFRRQHITDQNFKLDHKHSVVSDCGHLRRKPDIYPE